MSTTTEDSSSSSTSLPIPSPWQELSITNDRPPARGGHCSTIVTIATTPFLLIYGGCDPFGVASDQLFQISLETGKSQLCKVEANTCSPPKMSGGCLYALPFSSSSLTKKTEQNDNDEKEEGNNIITLILHGGIDYLPSCRIYGSTWIGHLNTSTCTVRWTQLEKTGISPVCRHSFASCLIVDDEVKLFVCGGSDGEKPLSSPMILDVKKAMMMTGQSSSSCWTSIINNNNTDELFKPAEMCSACYLSKSKLVLVAGGRDAQGQANDGLYCYNLSSSSSSSSPVFKKLTSSPSLQRTCASLAPLNSTDSVMMIGGVSHDEQIAALPLDVAIDLKFVVDVENNNKTTPTTIVVKQIRPIMRLEKSSNQQQEIDLVGGVHFGIGQSLAYSSNSTSSSKTCTNNKVACISGLFPNAMGHTTQIFVSSTTNQ